MGSPLSVGRVSVGTHPNMRTHTHTAKKTNVFACLREQLDVGRLPAALAGAAKLHEGRLELRAAHGGLVEQLAPAQQAQRGLVRRRAASVGQGVSAGLSRAGAAGRARRVVQGAGRPVEGTCMGARLEQRHEIDI